MNSYLIPTTQLEPKAIVIHCWTSDLRKEAEPEKLAKKYVDLRLPVIIAKNEDTISRIVPRNKWYSKQAKTTNERRDLSFKGHTIYLHGNTSNVSTHINYVSLHLTTRGSKLLWNNILNVATKLDISDWRFNHMGMIDRSKVSFNEKK